MANKINSEIGKYRYYRIRTKTGRKIFKNGKWIDEVINFYGRNKSDAEHKRDQWRADREQRELIFGEELQYYLTNVLFYDDSLAPSTKDLYLKSIRANLTSKRFLGEKVNNIDAKILQAEIDNLTCSRTTKRHIVTILKRFYAYLNIQYGVPNISQFLKVKTEHKTSERKIETWSDAELSALFDELQNNRYRLLFRIAIDTGLRFGEILGLKYSDIQGDLLKIQRQVISRPVIDDHGNVTSHIIETGALKSEFSYRTIPIANDLLISLKEHEEKHKLESIENEYQWRDYIFTSKNGELLSKANIRRTLERACKRANIPFHHFHCFRATFITRLAQSGTPLQVVKSLAGHGNIETTSKYYIAINDEERRKAIESLTAK